MISFTLFQRGALLIGIWLLTTFGAAAQQWRWATGNSVPFNSQRNASYTRITKTAVDSATGNLFAIGIFEAATTLGTFSLPAPQGFDGFVAMADSNGVWQWVVPLQGSNDNVLGDISLADPTALYVSGRAPGAATLGGVALPAGPDHSFVARLSRQGALQWAWRGPNIEAMAATASGKVYLAGSFSDSTVTLGSLTVPNAGPWIGLFGYDMYLAELSAAGLCEWATGVGGKDNQSQPLLTIDSNDNVVLALWASDLTYCACFPDSVSATFGSIQLGMPVIDGGAQVVFVAKLSPTHQWQWALAGYGGRGERITLGYGLNTDARGNIFLSGGREHPVFHLGTAVTTDTLTSNQANYAMSGFVARITPNGRVAWLTGTQNRDSDASIVATTTDATNTTYVTGALQEDSVLLGNLWVAPLPLVPGTYYNGFIAALDSIGTWRWAIPTAQLLTNPVVDDQRRLAVGGSYGGIPTIGPSTLPGPFGLFLAQLATPAIVYRFGPSGGGTGTLVTLAGVGFLGTTQVLVGGVSATFTVLSDGQIVVTVPPGVLFDPQGVAITVVGRGGAATALGRFNLTPTGLPGAVTRTPLTVWPSPAHGTATIRGGRPNTAVLLTDALGRSCVTAQLDTTGGATLPLHGLAAGLYIVRTGGATARLAVE